MKIVIVFTTFVYFIALFIFMMYFKPTILGTSLPNEVQNHVRPNFATPMLYAKNHSKFHNFFCRAIKPLELYFANF
jgi:hypothetical protein